MRADTRSAFLGVAISARCITVRRSNGKDAVKRRRFMNAECRTFVARKTRIIRVLYASAPRLRDVASSHRLDFERLDCFDRKIFPAFIDYDVSQIHSPFRTLVQQKFARIEKFLTSRIFRPHRSSTYVDVAHCHRPSSPSVCPSQY